MEMEMASIYFTSLLPSSFFAAIGAIITGTTVHEAGHFFVARYLNIPIQGFIFGKGSTWFSFEFFDYTVIVKKQFLSGAEVCNDTVTDEILSIRGLAAIAGAGMLFDVLSLVIILMIFKNDLLDYSGLYNGYFEMNFNCLKYSYVGLLITHQILTLSQGLFCEQLGHSDRFYLTCAWNSDMKTAINALNEDARKFNC